MRNTPQRPDLTGRVARFAALDALNPQARDALPQAAADLIWSRRLLPVLTRANESANPFGTTAPITGAGDLTITYAECPAGTGPGLHLHRATFETFTVMQGRFLFETSNSGEADDVEQVVLERFDAFSVPPGIYRGFRNIGEETGLLQVIITGGVHDRNDIVFAPAIGQAITGLGESCVESLRGLGLEFAAPNNGPPAGEVQSHKRPAQSPVAQGGKSA